MLVVLGFLAASLAALIIAPAFWARAVRLTTNRIKDAMPLSEIEIRADKDRLRAEYAIKVHKLESLVEQVRLAAARQQIEINRRDASINELETRLERLNASFEENQNARRVLEQTVADRLPRVENRLSEAKGMLFSRDREIGELTRTTDKQTRALAEAAAINAQQRAEIERLEMALSTRAARNQEGLADPRFDGEVALRAELESLRAKTREQAQMLVRLQSLAGRPTASVAEAGGPSLVVVNGGEPRDATGASGSAALAAADQRRLELEREVRNLRARTDDQGGEISRLKAALAVFEADPGTDARGSIRDSRLALKARLQSFEAQSSQQAETIQRLRGELAAANERLARQAAHFTNELKRLGAGTLPASGQPRRQVEPARLSLSERVAKARVAAASGGGEPVASDTPSSGPSPVEVAAPAAPAADDKIVDLKREPVAVEASETVAAGEPVAAAAPVAEPGQRPRLLERIASLSRTS